MKISFKMINSFLFSYPTLSNTLEGDFEEKEYVKGILLHFAMFIESVSTQTREQRGYYWAEIIPHISENTGYEPDETHDALLFKYAEITGKRDDNGLLKIKRTSQMDKEEYSNYIDWTIRFAAAEFGIAIRPPMKRY